jgi:hypothetical protein
MTFYYSFNKIVTTLVLNAEISISGEINVLAADHSRAIILDESLYENILIGVDLLSSRYNFIKITAGRELHEICIKFFANKKSIIPNEEFFQEFQVNISKFVEGFTDNAQLKVRVNLFGDVSSWESVDSFILVNNERDIYFKITKIEKMNSISNWMGSFVKNVLLRKVF